MAEDVPDIARLGDLLKLMPDWHPRLMTHLQRSLDNGLRDWAALDALLMSITKEVEAEFRSVVELRSQVQFPKLSGDGLVDEAVRYGLLTLNSPAWHDFKRYFGEPRNPFHHDFPKYSLTELAGFLLDTDRLLKRIDLLRQERVVPVQYSVSGDPSRRALDFTVLASGVPPSAEGQLVLETPRWRTELPLQQRSPGTYQGSFFPDRHKAPLIGAVFIAGDSSGEYRATSGTVVTVSSFLPPAP